MNQENFTRFGSLSVLNVKLNLMKMSLMIVSISLSLLLASTAHAGIDFSGMSNSPTFARNGGYISNLGEYVDYWNYLKRNHLLEEMLDDDWRRFKLLGRKFNVTIPRKQPKPNVGAIVYAGSMRLQRPGMCRE